MQHDLFLTQFRDPSVSAEPSRYADAWRVGDWTTDSGARSGDYATGLASSRFPYAALGGRSIVVPPPATNDALASNRAYEPNGLDDRQFAALISPACRSAFGMTYASAGALYSVHIYALRPTCDDAELWYAQTEDARLLLIDKVGAAEVGNALIEQWAWPTGVLIALVLDLRRVTDKYGHRGIRFATLEAGELTQLLRERAHKMGLISCALGGFADADVLRLLRLSPDWYGVAIMIGVGQGRANA